MWVFVSEDRALDLAKAQERIAELEAQVTRLQNDIGEHLDNVFGDEECHVQLSKHLHSGDLDPIGGE